MIGLGFIVRVLQFVFYLALASGILVGSFWLTNKLIQFVANQLGLTVTDFWGWFTSKFKKK